MNNKLLVDHYSHSPEDRSRLVIAGTSAAAALAITGTLAGLAFKSDSAPSDKHPDIVPAVGEPYKQVLIGSEADQNPNKPGIQTYNSLSEVVQDAYPAMDAREGVRQLIEDEHLSPDVHGPASVVKLNPDAAIGIPINPHSNEVEIAPNGPGPNNGSKYVTPTPAEHQP